MKFEFIPNRVFLKAEDILLPPPPPRGGGVQLRA